jgi:hypothetical protein
MARLQGVITGVILQGALCRRELNAFQNSLREVEQAAANARSGRGTWEDVERAVNESTTHWQALREPGQQLEDELGELRTAMEEAEQNLETATRTAEIAQELVRLIGEARVLVRVK